MSPASESDMCCPASNQHTERGEPLLFSGRTISHVGNAMAPVALAFAVLDRFGSPSALGVVIAARAGTIYRSRCSFKLGGTTQTSVIRLLTSVLRPLFSDI